MDGNRKPLRIKALLLLFGFPKMTVVTYLGISPISGQDCQTALFPFRGVNGRWQVPPPPCRVVEKVPGTSFDPHRQRLRAMSGCALAGQVVKGFRKSGQRYKFSD